MTLLCSTPVSIQTVTCHVLSMCVSMMEWGIYIMSPFLININFYHAEFFWKDIYLFAFNNIRRHWHDELGTVLWKFTQNEKGVLSSQYHDCWWPGHARSQGINRYDIDHVWPDHSGPFMHSINSAFIMFISKLWATFYQCLTLVSTCDISIKVLSVNKAQICKGIHLTTLWSVGLYIHNRYFKGPI